MTHKPFQLWPSELLGRTTWTSTSLIASFVYGIKQAAKGQKGEIRLPSKKLTVTCGKYMYVREMEINFSKEEVEDSKWVSEEKLLLCGLEGQDNPKRGWVEL